MASASPRVHFTSTGPFHADLKARVEAYFAQGRSQHGGARMLFKSAVMVAWLAASWSVLMFAHVSWWQAALLTISCALAQAGIGFSVMHDANHGGYSSSSAVNRAISFSLDLIGGSSYVWRHKHNVLHHTYTNISGLDTDLEAGPLLRFAPWQERKPMHRFQHFYVWLLFAFFPLRWWFVDDFRDVASGTIGTQTFPKPKARDLAVLLTGKALFFTWAFALPFALHPGFGVVALWLLGAFVLGNMLGIVFQLAHCAGTADFHDVGAGARLADWAAHQVTTTVDFARQSKVLCWYLGGLNFQVEHHLFPRVCHVHYPALARIVEATCVVHGVRYRAEPTLVSALSTHVAWLREMGRPEPKARPVIAAAAA